VEEHFVSVQLTDPVRPVDPMRQLQGRFAHCVHLEWAGSGAVADGRSYTERLSGRSDLEVAGEFVTHVRGVAATAAERDLLGRALAAAAREDASL
jgi:exonuclease SbcD